MSVNINPILFQDARRNLEKLSFVSAGDPGMGGGAPPAGGAPMDPSAGGGAPMDPSMAGGAPPDPSAGGGAPPMDPMAMLAPMIQQAVQQAMAANGGGGGPSGAGPGLKPKIDVNVEIMQIKKMLAKIVDALGIHIPAADMVATPEDLNQIAEGGAGYAATTPDNNGGGGALGQIQPISPVKAAEAWEQGVAFDIPSGFEQAQRQMKTNADLAQAMLLKKAAKR